MSNPGDIDAFREARGILRGMAADARQGRRLGDGGPDWERLRLHAFRYFVLRPIFHGGRACLRGLAAARAATRAAARNQTDAAARRPLLSARLPSRGDEDAGDVIRKP